MRGEPKNKGLTKREREVLELTARGLTLQETASHLGISVKTADCHKTAAREKTGLRRPVDLAFYAIQHGLIDKGEPGPILPQHLDCDWCGREMSWGMPSRWRFNAFEFCTEACLQRHVMVRVLHLTKTEAEAVPV